MTSARQRLDAGAWFASKCECDERVMYLLFMSGEMSLSLRHMENVGHFIKAVTRLVAHTFVSTTSFTKHVVQKRTYLSTIGRSLMISGRSWKKKKRRNRKADLRRSRHNSCWPFKPLRDHVSLQEEAFCKRLRS